MGSNNKFNSAFFMVIIHETGYEIIVCRETPSIIMRWDLPNPFVHFPKNEINTKGWKLWK